MIRQALRFFWRTLWGERDRSGLLTLPWRYRRTFVFLLRTQGLRAAWRFLQVKVMARGERVGLALLDPVSLLRPAWTPRPRMIEVEVTTRCHLRCVHCECTAFPAAYRNQDLSYAAFVRLLDQLPGLRYINCTGEGSSFLNADFPAMLRECRRRGIYVTAIDSFSALKTHHMADLLLYAHKVPISLDGATKAAYEVIRVGATWELTLANIRRFLAMRTAVHSPLPEVTFRFIFCQANYRDLPLFPALVDALMGQHRRDGFDGFVELVGLLEFAGTEKLVWEPDPEIVGATTRELERLGLPYAWSHPSHDPAQKRPMSECAAWAEPYVMIDGSVIPCCSLLMSNRREFLEAHAFGNVNVQSFDAIWDSPRYRVFRGAVPHKGWPVPRICVGCRAFDTTARQARYGVDETL